MAILKLIKLQKLGVRARRGNQNQVLHSHQNQRENKKRFKTRLLAYIRIMNLFHLLQCSQISILLNCNLWDISRGTISHINVFLAYLLVQELFLNKNHFLEFLSVGCNVALQQLNIFAANRNTNLIQTFQTFKRAALRAIFIAKFHQRNQPH